MNKDTSVTREIIKKERNRIEKDLIEYMEGTCLEQDSIFLNLHDIINCNYKKD